MRNFDLVRRPFLGVQTPEEEEEEEEEEEDEEAIDEKDWAGTKSTQIQTDTDQREFYEASRKNVLCVDITHFNK